MSGYWVVIAMLAIAVVAVLVAVAAEDQSDRPPRPVHGDARSDRAVVILGTAQDDSGNDWVARLGAHLPPSVTVRDLRIAEGTLASIPREHLASALAAAPALVVLGPPFADIESGVSLTSYEQDLAAILATLATNDIRAVVGNLPRLDTIDPNPMSPERSAMLRLTGEHWNAAIARLASAYGADVVDLDPLSDPPTPDLSSPDRLADLFRPVVLASLANATVAPAAR